MNKRKRRHLSSTKSDMKQVRTSMNKIDIWIDPQLQTNRVAFNKDTKEFIIVTNGTCILDHSSPEGYAKDHINCGCKYRPHEGIVLRIIGFEDDIPIHGWTYVSIPKGANLEPAPANKEWFIHAFLTSRFLDHRELVNLYDNNCSATMTEEEFKEVERKRMRG